MCFGISGDGFSYGNIFQIAFNTVQNCNYKWRKTPDMKSEINGLLFIFIFKFLYQKTLICAIWRQTKGIVFVRAKIFLFITIIFWGTVWWETVVLWCEEFILSMTTLTDQFFFFFLQNSTKYVVTVVEDQWGWGERKTTSFTKTCL